MILTTNRLISNVKLSHCSDRVIAVLCKWKDTLLMDVSKFQLCDATLANAPKVPIFSRTLSK
jgi:hypothetical protein